MASEGRLPKPQLRDFHIAKAKKSLVIATTLCAIIGLSFKIFVSDLYEQKAENFYKTYDAMASLKRMNEAGLMESYPI